MKVIKNKGKYIETLIEKTIDYYNFKKIGIFEKRYLPIDIYQVNGNNVAGRLVKKSYVDYHGLYQGKYIDFETKQTMNDYFLFSIIKKHQLDHIINVTKHGGIAFLIIHFFKLNKYYFVDAKTIEKMMLKKGKICLDFFEKNCEKILVVFPGILDFICKIKTS